MRHLLQQLNRCKESPPVMLLRCLHNGVTTRNELAVTRNFDVSINGQVIDVSEIQYFPGYQDRSIPPVRIGQHNGLPHIVKFLKNKESSLESIGKQCREYLDENLIKHGAILFKDLPLPSVEDFASFFDSLNYEKMEYEGGASSRPLDEDNSAFYQASDEPPLKLIEPHNEQAYFDTCPGMVIFYGKEPAGPGCGGETILCHNRNLLKSINPIYVDKVLKKKIRYIRNCPDKSAAVYKPWQDTFYTNDKKKVEEILEAKGGGWEWRENDWLHFWSIGDVLRRHPMTGKEYWFNQITLASCSYFRTNVDAEKWRHLKDDECPTHVTYGDGEEIEAEFSQNVRQVTYDNSVALKLEKSDVIVIDNFQVQHGRMPFRGRRSLTTALLK